VQPKMESFGVLVDLFQVELLCQDQVEPLYLDLVDHLFLFQEAFLFLFQEVQVGLLLGWIIAVRQQEMFLSQREWVSPQMVDFQQASVRAYFLMEGVQVVFLVPFPRV